MNFTAATSEQHESFALIAFRLRATVVLLLLLHLDTLALVPAKGLRVAFERITDKSINFYLAEHVSPDGLMGVMHVSSLLASRKAPPHL